MGLVSHIIVTHAEIAVGLKIIISAGLVLHYSAS